MKALHTIAFLLVVVGGLNWLLVGINPEYNLVALIVGNWPAVENTVYILVGVSALYLLASHKKTCKDCVGSMQQ